MPPQPTTNGDEEGRSTFAGVGPPSLESLSPDAAKTVMPAAAAALAAAFNLSAKSMPAACPAACQLASSVPQEMEQTSHPSAAAAEIAVAIDPQSLESAQ
ncbi:MAG TPA: hypothetical protein VGG86_01890 [Roseiarcus sp.]